MTIGGFRPRLVPTLFTVPVVLVCLALGVWQLQRLQWKEGLIATREAGLAAPATAPPRSLDEARALEFHRVVAAGVFLHDRELLRIAPGPTGGSGFDVLTPLRQPDGRIILVNRGFVPIERQESATRLGGQIPGTVLVSGLLRLPPTAKPSWFLPDNRPDRGYWFWIDLPAMVAAGGLGDVAAFYIEADATPNPGGWPKGTAIVTPLPNDHLQYAITWFSLAVAAVVIYVLSQRGDARANAGDHDRLPRP
jgi:surfeit locus 1 family protein